MGVSRLSEQCVESMNEKEDLALPARAQRELNVQRLQKRLVTFENFRASRHEIGVGVARRRFRKFDRSGNMRGRIETVSSAKLRVGDLSPLNSVPGLGSR